MVGMGENAGVVDVGEGWAVTFKVESHNHPSLHRAVPGRRDRRRRHRARHHLDGRPPGRRHGPAALRRTSTTRTPPASCTASSRGISFYGNCLGLPNIGGETYFDSVYQGNPLVNALAVGVLRHEDLHLANARGVGNKVVLFGARTGGDGIGGASILASDTFAEGGPTKRPAVQVGDPFAEKVLIECCLELFAGDLVEGIQDLGAAGISCATSELAANGDGGMFIELDEVLLRDPTLTAEEILMSESQERMMAIVQPEKLEAFLAVVAKWDVETSVLGEVTDTGRLVINWHGEEIVNVDPRTVAVDGPVYDRPVAYPTWIDALQADTASALPRPTDRDELRDAVPRAARQPQPRRQAWITNQYDRYVLGNTALSSPTTAAWSASTRRAGSASRSRPTRTAATASSTRTQGAQLALAEAYRNVAVTGATPGRGHRLPELRLPGEPRGHVAVLPSGRGPGRRLPRARDPGHRRQRLVLQPDRRRARSTRRRSSACSASSTTSRSASRPAGRTRATTSTCSAPRALELDGSAWAGVVHDHLGGRPPAVDLEARAAARRAARRRRAGGAHRLARTTSPTAAWRRRSPSACCASASAPASGSTRLIERDGVDAATALFSESTGRVLVERAARGRREVPRAVRGPRLPVAAHRRDGCDSGTLEVQDLFTVPIDELRATHRALATARRGTRFKEFRPSCLRFAGIRSELRANLLRWVKR